MAIQSVFRCLPQNAEDAKKTLIKTTKAIAIAATIVGLVIATFYLGKIALFPPIINSYSSLWKVSIIQSASLCAIPFTLMFTLMDLDSKLIDSNDHKKFKEFYSSLLKTSLLFLTIGVLLTAPVNFGEWNGVILTVI